MDLLNLDAGTLEVRRCPYTGTTEIKHVESGATSCISAWREPNEQELIYEGTRLFARVERDRLHLAERRYFWLGAEAERV